MEVRQGLLESAVLCSVSCDAWRARRDVGRGWQGCAHSLGGSAIHGGGNPLVENTYRGGKLTELIVLGGS